MKLPELNFESGWSVQSNYKLKATLPVPDTQTIVNKIFKKATLSIITNRGVIIAARYDLIKYCPFIMEWLSFIQSCTNILVESSHAAQIVFHEKQIITNY